MGPNYMLTEGLLYVDDPVDEGDLDINVLHVVLIVWVPDHLELKGVVLTFLGEVAVPDVKEVVLGEGRERPQAIIEMLH
jgi:hypothetical protein